MFDFAIIAPAVVNGLTMGAIYALVALGLTVIYGVLHIINFAHGSLLMAALYGVYFMQTKLSIDPYLALPFVVLAMFALGYSLQRFIIGQASHGRDENALLVTLGIALVIENITLYAFTADTRTIETSYSFQTVDIGFAFVTVPRLVGFVSVFVFSLLLWMLMTRTNIGRAVRALARERQGAKVVGIDVEHVFAMSFGIGCALLGAAACLLLPAFYVSPFVGQTFVMIAFTVVVLGGMGSFLGALVGGLIVGVTESLGGLFLGESLGQLAIFVIFIAVVLIRPSGFFGQRTQ